jgi:hypothetical protein
MIYLQSLKELKVFSGLILTRKLLCGMQNFAHALRWA